MTIPPDDTVDVERTTEPQPLTNIERIDGWPHTCPFCGAPLDGPEGECLGSHCPSKAEPANDNADADPHGPVDDVLEGVQRVIDAYRISPAATNYLRGLVRSLPARLIRQQMAAHLRFVDQQRKLECPHCAALLQDVLTAQVMGTINATLDRLFEDASARRAQPVSYDGPAVDTLLARMADSSVQMALREAGYQSVLSAADRAWDSRRPRA